MSRRLLQKFYPRNAIRADQQGLGRRKCPLKRSHTLKMSPPSAFNLNAKQTLSLPQRKIDFVFVIAPVINFNARAQRAIDKKRAHRRLHQTSPACGSCREAAEPTPAVAVSKALFKTSHFGLKACLATFPDL